MAYGGGQHGFGGGAGNYELRLPPGWEDCPEFGSPINITPDGKEVFKVIPSKVPLSFPYNRLLRDENKGYSLRQAVDKIERRFNCRVGMVIDLTNSRRYYQFGIEFPDAAQRGIEYIKVPCRGRGASPDPEQVNRVVYELLVFRYQRPDDYVLMHCTHGFNRTGYVIACAMARLCAARGITVDRAVRRFADARPPGIYKDQYINDLFRYHHEKRQPHIKTPPVPAWKPTEDEDDEPDQAEEAEPAAPAHIGHERIEDIGEAICEAECGWIQGMIYGMITGRQLHEGQRPHFPGSQPVSLARANLHLLEDQRYWVSWKADGTRYLLLIMEQGCYLVDRSFKIRRLQMRFPTLAHLHSVPGKPYKQAAYPVGKPHHMTLLDGEMVVDVDKATGNRYRRYLAYDMASINDEPIMDLPWEKRFHRLEEEVVKPRAREKGYILKQIDPSKERYSTPPLPYDYSLEPFSVRRKDFWPLYRGHKVIEMINILCHESDGLILQSCESRYVANTDNALLKFKFPWCNSVDFKLIVSKRDGGQLNFSLWVMDTKRGRGRNGAPNLTPISTPVHFPEGVNGQDYDNCIIECTWKVEDQCWLFHRKREDKDTPNAYHVYEKVKVSIDDNITSDELLGYMDSVFWHCQHYAKDRAVVPENKKPTNLPPRPHELDMKRAAHALPPPPLHEQPPQQAHFDYPPPPEQPPYEEREVPMSPPYFGPDPTPPREDDQEQPMDPATWPQHDPDTYPFHILPPPAPADGGGEPPHADPAWQDQAPPGQQDNGHQQWPEDHEQHPDDDVNPRYVDPEVYRRHHPNSNSHNLQHPPENGNGTSAAGGDAWIRSEGRSPPPVAAGEGVRPTKKKKREKDAAPINYEDDFDGL